jgi:hypothetical protein
VAAARPARRAAVASDRVDGRAFRACGCRTTRLPGGARRRGRPSLATGAHASSPRPREMGRRRASLRTYARGRGGAPRRRGLRGRGLAASALRIRAGERALHGPTMRLLSGSGLAWGACPIDPADSRGGTAAFAGHPAGHPGRAGRGPRRRPGQRFPRESPLDRRPAVPYMGVLLPARSAAPVGAVATRTVPIRRSGRAV